MKKRTQASLAFVALAVGTLLHHAYIHDGIFFQLEDIMSHEFLVGIFVASAVVLFYSDKIVRRMG